MIENVNNNLAMWESKVPEYEEKRKVNQRKYMQSKRKTSKSVHDGRKLDIILESEMGDKSH